MDDTPSRNTRALSIPQLRAQITELAGHLNAAHHRWLLLIAEFDRRQGWSDVLLQHARRRRNASAESPQARAPVQANQPATAVSECTSCFRTQSGYS
jgi:hypothetical protein